MRCYFRPHPLNKVLKSEDEALPLVVFLHGLGGSAAQFEPLIREMGFVASYLAIDLPGCGRSAMEPTRWDAYECPQLLDCLTRVILHYLDRDRSRETDTRAVNGDVVPIGDTVPDRRQKIILIGHSMGAAHAAQLATTTFISRVIGLVALCPPNTFPPSKARMARLFLSYFPERVFNLLRWWDQRGGPDSASVKRFTGPEADIWTRRRQWRYNLQSRTPTFRRCASGILPQYRVPDGKDPPELRAQSAVLIDGIGMPSINTWQKLACPVLILVGGKDEVVKVDESKILFDALAEGRSKSAISSDTEWFEQWKSRAQVQYSDLQWLSPGASSEATSQAGAFAMAVFSTANHTIPYDTPTLPELASLVTSFLAALHPSLSPGVQHNLLSDLTSSGHDGKRGWVPDPAKWDSTPVISSAIGGIFRTMKSPRTGDAKHSPEAIVSEYFSGTDDEPGSPLGAVIDITSIPTYDANAFTNSGKVIYRRYPSESTSIPTPDEIEQFCEVIEETMKTLRMDSLDLNGGPDKSDQPGTSKQILVHCDYGVTRAAFFIVSYLVLRHNWPVSDAISEVNKARTGRSMNEKYERALEDRYSDMRGMSSK